MIELRTGQPGAGKTLFAIADIRERAELENRTVYYSGIADLRVPGWVELDDGAKWHQCPAGAIIVIDEAQRVFRPRMAGAQVPEHVAKLETHRHSGHDLILVTQHPKLLDTNVRRLVGRHLHVMRAFGTRAAVVHEWNEVRPDPDLSREGSITTSRKYPTDVFALYKSAEVHTHKSRVPLRVWLLFFAPFLLAGTGYGLYVWIKARTGADASGTVSQISSASGVVKNSGAAQGVVSKLTADEWIAQRVPRVAGLPFTAPLYDDVMVVQSAPVPVGCVSSKGRCHCYTEQATRLDVGVAECMHIVDRGYFDARRPSSALQAAAGGHEVFSPSRPSVPASASSGALPSAPFVAAPVRR